MPENKGFYISKTKDAEDLPLPEYMTEGASGLDLRANVFEDTLLKPREILLVPTGIKISLPKGYEGQIRPRSGLSLKYGVTQLNSPGTIDSDYRGEIKVILINCGKNDYVIKRGERIAQLVISKVEIVSFIEKEISEDTERGVEGFGHTGNN